MDNNDKTLQSYEENIQEYLSGTPQTAYDSLKNWIDKALTFVPKGGTVLELGSGPGRDAAYMQSKGYRVMATDATQGFVDLLQKAGHDSLLLNALTDEFGTDYDMIFAHAVLLHFNPEQVRLVIEKAYKSLKPKGVLAFSVKLGKGSAWTNEKLDSPRFFHYWQKPELDNLLKTTSFSSFEITEGKSTNAKWLYVISKK